jgi:hypothetical protein
LKIVVGRLEGCWRIEKLECLKIGKLEMDGWKVVEGLEN